jgi:hypothetical protein
MQEGLVVVTKAPSVSPNRHSMGAGACKYSIVLQSLDAFTQSIANLSFLIMSKCKNKSQSMDASKNSAIQRSKDSRSRS